VNAKFFIRVFVYVCAFAGAGLFGEAVYIASKTAWDSSLTWIIVCAVVAALLLATIQYEYFDRPRGASYQPRERSDGWRIR
jgi:hypothetical protein